MTGERPSGKRGRSRRLAGRGLIGAACGIGLVAGLMVVSDGAAGASGASRQQPSSAVQQVHRLGAVNLHRLSDAARGRAASTGSHPARAVPLGPPPVAQPGAAGQTRTRSPLAPGAAERLSGNVRGENGFTGVTAPENAAVNPSIGDVSPPDQGLAVGPSPAPLQGPAIVDFVNQSLSIYNSNGSTLSGNIPAYQVFNLPASSFLSDPRAYWDSPTHRWFLTMFTFGSASAPTSTQYIAVSQTSDVFGNYTIFSIDTTGTGQPNCPCFGDFDQIGADANGFYITTNEFGEKTGYNGAVLYALSKAQLERDATTMTGTPRLVTYRVPTDAFGQTYHISPASTPQYQKHPGTEYFVESNGDAIYGSSLEVYALLDTALLNSTGTPVLVRHLVHTRSYAQPPNARQKAGPIPLGESQGYGEGQLQTDFDAVQEVTWTGGNLYAELDTGVPYGTQQRAAAAWFVIHPVASGNGVTATVVKQGVVTSSQNLLYPHITVSANGRGFMNFAVAGDTTYPSPGYVTFAGTAGAMGAIHIARPGANPLDDFTCYPPYGSACRYGDYSGGAAFGTRIYMATEYVGAVARDNKSNWATFVWSAPRP